MEKKMFWLTELFLIIIAVSLTLQFRLLLGSKDFISYFFGSSLNIIVCLSLLLFALHKLFKQNNIKSVLKSCFLKKILFTDIFIVVLLIVFSSISYVLLYEIDFIHFIRIKRLPALKNLSNLQNQILFFQTLFFILIIVLSEELYFRCYLFEKQLLYFRSYTWIINGLSWSVFHIFTPTNFIALLPTCLLYSYIYQKRRNIWLTIFAHLINNLIVYYPTLSLFFKNS